MAKAKIIGQPWDFTVEWNKALNCVPERPLIKREHCWASELGGSFVDRYLRMNAIPYTNPPNERSRRKFQVGDVFEWIVGMVLTSIGILQQRQIRNEVQLPGLLKVTGKLDYVAGGVVDWEKSLHEINKLKILFSQTNDETPRFISHTIDHVFNAMRKRFSTSTLMEVIFECKSISVRMFEKVEKTGAMPHHVLQSGHYLIGNNRDITLAKICYISKDDCLMTGFDLQNSKELRAAYKKDVQQMTEYFNAGNKDKPLKTLPPKEPEVLFDPLMFRFEKNFRVEYSSYLEMLYGYKTPEEFRFKWSKEVSNWNRVFKRCVMGEKMTDKNKAVLSSVAKMWPNWDDYVYKAKSKGVFLKDDE